MLRGMNLGGGEFEELDLPGSFHQVEEREGDRQGETSRTSTAWIDVEDAALQVRFGLVGVATDDDLKAGSGGIEVELLQIV